MPVETLKSTAVTIANGASLSGALEMTNGNYMCGIIMPAAWTAADLTFEASHDDITYNDLYDQDGVEVSASADVDRYIILNPNKFWGIKYIKVRSGTSASAVNQAAERSIILLFREL